MRALCLMIAALTTATTATPVWAQDKADCAKAVARGDDLPCQLVLRKGRTAPFKGVLLSPAKARRTQADLATLETALAEQRKLTDAARAERDAARAESSTVVRNLLETGQRMEKANGDLIKAQASLDASNRELAEAVEAMPTRTTLILAGTLIALGAFGAGYGLGQVFK